MLGVAQQYDITQGYEARASAECIVESLTFFRAPDVTSHTVIALDLSKTSFLLLVHDIVLNGYITIV